MKKITCYFCALVAFVLMFNACSNDFDLADSWQDIPVVYGLLNANDTVHYIKVERAFLDEETSAIVVAQEPDSLYYQEVTVELEEINSTGAAQFSFEMELVDGNDEGLPKEDGVFATSPNYLFKTTEPLNPELRYNVNIKIGSGEEQRTVTIQENNGQRAIGLISDFTVTKPNENVNFNFEPGRNSEFRWFTEDDNDNENAAFYDVVMYINYFEQESGNPATKVEKTLEWVLRTNMTAIESTTQQFEIEGIAFYQYLSQQLEPVGLNICRELNNFDFVVYAGGQDLYEYINRQSANTGITGTQPFSEYTNMSEGLGIISTRYDKRMEGLNFNAFVTDELPTNDLTKDLGFIEFGNSCN